MIDQATAFVIDRVDLAVGTRAEGKTASVPTDYELPPDAVKEAIVNAVAHRDYTSNGSVQVMLFRNRLEVWNPGQLPYGLTVSKLLEPHKSLPANPLIADPLFWTGYVDKVGTGTEDIVNLCKDKGLKSPEYHQEEDFRVVIWRRNQDTGPSEDISKGSSKGSSKDQVVTKLSPSCHQVVTKLSSSIPVIFELLRKMAEPMSAKEMREFCGQKDHTYFKNNVINLLIAERLVAMTHPERPNSPAQKYYLTETGKALLEDR